MHLRAASAHAAQCRQSSPRHLTVVKNYSSNWGMREKTGTYSSSKGWFCDKGRAIYFWGWFLTGIICLANVVRIWPDLDRREDLPGYPCSLQLVIFVHGCFQKNGRMWTGHLWSRGTVSLQSPRRPTKGIPLSKTETGLRVWIKREPGS